MTQALGTGLTTKPRWDKRNPYVGNFRGPLANDLDLATQANVVLACGVNSSGAVVFGAGNTGIKGLTIIPVGTDMQGGLLDGGINTEAGDICDVTKHGEIVNFRPSSAGNSYGVAVTVGSGTYTLTVNGTPTAGVAFGANAATLEAAIVAVDDSMVDADVTVIGTAPNFTVTLPVGKTLAVGAGATVTPPATTAAAGTNYFAHSDGSVTATKGGDGIYVGHTVEADRLIVNVNDEA